GLAMGFSWFGRASSCVSTLARLCAYPRAMSRFGRSFYSVVLNAKAGIMPAFLLRVNHSGYRWSGKFYFFYPQVIHCHNGRHNIVVQFYGLLYIWQGSEFFQDQSADGFVSIPRDFPVHEMVNVFYFFVAMAHDGVLVDSFNDIVFYIGFVADFSHDFF